MCENRVLKKVWGFLLFLQGKYCIDLDLVSPHSGFFVALSWSDS